MVNQITANDLKVKGISAIEEIVDGNNGVVITVRGIEKYVVLPIEEYNHLREYELYAAIQEVKNEIANGSYYSGSIEDHFERVINV